MHRSPSHLSVTLLCATIFSLTTTLTSVTASTSTIATPSTPPVVDFHKGFSEIAELAIPSVVNVSTTQVVEKGPPSMMFPGMGDGGGSSNPLEDFFKGFMDPDAQSGGARRVQSLGSGFIIKVTDTDAFIVTNYHVVEGAKKITLILHDKAECDATLHAFDERTDLAVLKIKLSSLPEAKRKLHSLEWGSSSGSKVGHFVVAIGNPFGLGSTCTSGTISGKGRDIVLRNKNRATDFVDDFIQHDASINMGNSGGALLNMEGKVIGVNTAIFSPNGGSIGIGFAIPSDLVKSTVDQLLEKGIVERGWLGITLRPLDQEKAEILGLKNIRGGIVEAVSPGSPAAKAGLKERDIIVEIDSKKLDDSNHNITRIVGELPVGKEIPIKILRPDDQGEKKDVELKVILGKFPTTPAATVALTEGNNKDFQGKTGEFLGLKVAEFKDVQPSMDPQKKTLTGLVILSVQDKSSGEDSGLRKGDVITGISVNPVLTIESAEKLIEKAKKDKLEGVMLTIVRAGRPSEYVTVRFKSLSESSVIEKKVETAKVTLPETKASEAKKEEKISEKSATK